MAHDLSYDMMLEVQGLIRSPAVRINVDRELRVGERFNRSAGTGSSPRFEPETKKV